MLLSLQFLVSLSFRIYNSAKNKNQIHEGIWQFFSLIILKFSFKTLCKTSFKLDCFNLILFLFFQILPFHQHKFFKQSRQKPEQSGSRWRQSGKSGWRWRQQKNGSVNHGRHDCRSIEATPSHRRTWGARKKVDKSDSNVENRNVDKIDPILRRSDVNKRQQRKPTEDVALKKCQKVNAFNNVKHHNRQHRRRRVDRKRRFRQKRRQPIDGSVVNPFVDPPRKRISSERHPAKHRRPPRPTVGRDDVSRATTRPRLEISELRNQRFSVVVRPMLQPVDEHEDLDAVPVRRLVDSCPSFVRFWHFGKKFGSKVASSVFIGLKFNVASDQNIKFHYFSVSLFLVIKLTYDVHSARIVWLHFCNANNLISINVSIKLFLPKIASNFFRRK